MNEQTMRDFIMEALNGTEHETEQGDTVAAAEDFMEHGVLTHNAGTVITMSDGSVFYATIQQKS